MSQATVFSDAQYGLQDETSATGIVVSSITWSGTSETVELPDHLGCAIGFAIYNPKKDVSGDGVIATKGTGLVGDIADAVTLANTTTNSRTRNSEGLGVTDDANAAILITGNNIAPAQTGFEGGGFTGVYLPFVATNSPVTLS
jgi:hypothetical protein